MEELRTYGNDIWIYAGRKKAWLENRNKHKQCCVFWSGNCIKSLLHSLALRVVSFVISMAPKHHLALGGRFDKTEKMG